MTAQPILEFLPSAIAAGERALQRSMNLSLPDGRPDPLGLATPAAVMPATLATLLDAARELRTRLEGCADGRPATGLAGNVNPSGGQATADTDTVTA